jgi:hypothetical protein
MVSNTYQEKELLFTFAEGTVWRVLDLQGVRLPVGMALVDFVIERTDDILFVEIKDPSHSQSPIKERNKYLKRLTDDSVLSQELTPKARDSYAHEHLMGRDNKPIVYVVLIGLDAFEREVQRAILNNFSHRLYKSLRTEGEVPWVREHIKQCIVLSVDAWNEEFPDYRVERVKHQEAAIQ